MNNYLTVNSNGELFRTQDSYNITKGTTVNGIPESNHACTAPGCLGLQSPTDDYVLAANDKTGATFYNMIQSTKQEPVSEDVKVSQMLTLVRGNPSGPNPSSDESNIAAIVVPVVLDPAFILIIFNVIIRAYWWRRSPKR